MATREELEEILSDLCPNYKIRKDRTGKLVIHTNLTEDEYGELHDDEEDIRDEDEDDEDDLADLTESDEDELLNLDEDEI